MRERYLYFVAIGILLVAIWRTGQKVTNDSAATAPQPMRPSDTTLESAAAPPPAVVHDKPSASSQSAHAAPDGSPPSKSDKKGTRLPSDSKSPERTADQKETSTRPKRSASVDRGGFIGRAIGDHFASHPPTEKRILHLRHLDQKPVQEPADAGDALIDLKNDLSRAGTGLAIKVAGPLKVDEEWKIGGEVAKTILQQNEIDIAQSERLALLAKPFLQQLKRTQSQPYTFTVMKDKQINAFAHLGGHVYVCTGLLELAENDVQIQFVLGHEIAHVELRHCADGSLAAIRAKQAVGELASIPVALAQQLVGLSYSEFNEHESDAWSFRRLLDQGAAQHDALSFLYRMKTHEERLVPTAKFNSP